MTTIQQPDLTKLIIDKLTTTVLKNASPTASLLVTCAKEALIIIETSSSKTLSATDKQTIIVNVLQTIVNSSDIAADTKQILDAVVVDVCPTVVLVINDISSELSSLKDTIEQSKCCKSCAIL